MARFRRGLCGGLLILSALTTDAAAAPSDVDTTFGDGGTKKVAIGDSFAESRDAVLQADGKVVLVGNKGGADRSWPVARLTAGGQPDLDFDGDGQRTIPVSGAANAVAQQGDGKLLVAGTEGTGSSDDPYEPNFVLARLNTDGSLDQSFGDGGIVRTTMSDRNGWTANPAAIALQPGGGILVAGSAPGAQQVVVVRYDGDGDEDTTFGGGDGIAALPPTNGDARPAAMLVDPGGRIVVAGHTPDDEGYRVALLARLLANGDPDPEFGSGGVVHADWHQGGERESDAVGLARQASGKLVVAGSTSDFGDTVPVLARFDAGGHPDTSFGEGGVTRTGIGHPEALTIAPGGKLLVAGWEEAGQALARYDDEGDPDTAFGSQGVVVNGAANRATDVNVQPADGRIVLTGFGNGNFSATRFVGDPPPPDPGDNDPGGTDGPGEDDSEGCEHELRRFVVIARAACFKTDGDWKTSDALVRINGLDLVPVAGTRIKLRPGDFHLRTEAPGGGLGLVDVRAGTITLARMGFDVGVGSALVFRAADSASIDGFRIAGDVTVAFLQNGTATLKGSITSSLINGAFEGRMEMDGSLIADSLAIEVPGFAYGPLASVQPLRLNFAPSSRDWSGSGGFRLGRGAGAMDFGGRMVIADGRWREVSGTAGLLPMGVLPVRNVSFSMRDVGGSLQIAGAAGLPLGSLSGLDAFNMDGALSATVPLSLSDIGDFAWRLRGTATLFGTAALTSGELRVDQRKPTFTGRAEWGLKAGQFANIASGADVSKYDASVSAAVRYANNQASGSGTAKVFGLGIGVDMTYGSQGVGACGDVRVGVGPLSTVVRGGATMRFHPTRYAALVGACDLSSLSSASAAAAGARSVRLPGGRRAGVLVVRGKGAPPRVRIQGPGAALTMARGAKPQRRGRFLVLQAPGEDATYVLIAKPRGGRWSARALPGSAAVRSVTPAAALPPIRVKGKVTRAKGGKRVLRWRGKGVPGHVLRFREIGGGVNRPIGSSRKGKGTLRFTPAPGAKGARSIVALAERGGVPRTTLRVARYKP